MFLASGAPPPSVVASGAIVPDELVSAFLFFPLDLALALFVVALPVAVHVDLPLPLAVAVPADLPLPLPLKFPLLLAVVNLLPSCGIASLAEVTKLLSGRGTSVLALAA
jgi:hypothetical protein